MARRLDSPVLYSRHIRHPPNNSKLRTVWNSSQDRFVSKGFEYLKAKSRTVNISVSSGESDVAMAASSCEREWYIRGFSIDIQITKEEEKQEKNSEEGANVAKIGILCHAKKDRSALSIP